MQNSQFDELIKSIQALADAKQFVPALEKLDALITLNKKNHYLYNMRGVINLQRTKFDLSMKDLKKAIQLKPDYAVAHSNLGSLHRTMRNISEAEDCFHRAYSIDDQDKNTLINYGNLLQSERRYLVANEIYAKLIKLFPGDAMANALYGSSLVELNRIEEAIAYQEKSASIEPGSHIYNLIGLSYMYLGSQDRAEEFFKQSIEENILNISAYYHLSDLKNFEFNDAEWNFLCGIKTQLPDEDQVLLNYTLANIYRKRGNHKEEMKCLHEGSSLQYKLTPYDHSKRSEYFNKIKQFYSASQDQYAITEDSGLRLIFIVGMPRSGTSLLEQLISNHKDVHGAGERNELGAYLNRVIEGGGPLRKKISKLKCARINYLKTVRSLTEKKIIIDKLPENFMYCGFIEKLFPEAKVIHLSRRPLATTFSIYQQKFEHPGMSYSFNMESIIKYYELYREFIDYWRASSINFLDISYEDLVTSPKKIVGDIFNYLDLDFNETMLHTAINKRSIMTASVNQVREKIHTGSISNWETYREYIGPLVSYFEPN